MIEILQNPGFAVAGWLLYLIVLMIAADYKDENTELRNKLKKEGTDNTG